jgi:hypothetical protein
MTYLVTIYKIPLREEKNKAHVDAMISASSRAENYDKVPSKYEKYTWPIRTNLQCASCSYSGSRSPFFIPVGKESGCFIRCNNPIFCSPACALYVVMQLGDVSTREKKILLIRDLAREMFGFSGVITPSPNPYILKRHGGTMSDKDFHNNIYQLNPELIGMMYQNKQDMVDDLS